jgi:zona occludens toxin (predicted ATPase)
MERKVEGPDFRRYFRKPHFLFLFLLFLLLFFFFFFQWSFTGFGAFPNSSALTRRTRPQSIHSSMNSTRSNAACPGTMHHAPRLETRLFSNWGFAIENE